MVPNNLTEASEIALKVIHKHFKFVGGKRNIRTSRVKPVPKFAGATTGITKGAQAAKVSREQLRKLTAKEKHRNIENRGKGTLANKYRFGA